MLKLYILYSEKLDYHMCLIMKEKRIQYGIINEILLDYFSFHFIWIIIDRAMIEMFPCDNHFLFPLFLHGYDFPWEKL